MIVQFDGANTISGGRINQYLLEKTRIVKQGPGERNYHIFYFLFHADPALRETLKLTKIEDFEYLKIASTAPGVKDEQEFKEVTAAFTKLGISDMEVESIYRLVAGIAHVGNASFEGEENVKIKCHDKLHNAAR